MSDPSPDVGRREHPRDKDALATVGEDVSETGFDPGLYDRFPLKGDRPEGELEALKKAWKLPTGIAYLTVINNNVIGYWYIVTTLGFFLAAGILSLFMRVQLAAPMMEVLPQELYNQMFTMHGSTMMFLFAVPAVEAVAVMLLPQMLASRELPFPRLSAYAYWAYLIGGVVFFCSILFAVAPDGGWFMYPPLTSNVYSPGINADFWLLGIGFIEISAIAGAIELIIGVLRCRPPGMTLARMPIYAWGVLIFAVMVILAFPAMISVTFLLELERLFNLPLFDATRGGDPLLYQHLFWFFGHPEVYLIFLPASAMISTMIATVARNRLVGHDLIVLAMIATGFISFGVWAHHMFATGMPRLATGYFSAASMAVAMPAGVQVFAWIATLAGGKVQRSVPTLFLIGAIVIFVMGGLTGVMVGMVAFDHQSHDTYFIVAHFHYVLIGGMLFPLFAGLYYWAPMISKTALSERLGTWVFWLMFCGVHICFLPMHLTGLMGMPRRVNTYLPGRDWDIPNLISTIGAFVMAAGVLLFLIDCARNFRFTTGTSAGDQLGAGTMEWLPGGQYSVRSIPIVKDRYPLWSDPNLARDVEEGRYLLPGTITGGRETIITSTLRAEPLYLQQIPSPSVWPLAAAIFTAGFFLLLTMKAVPLAVLSLLLMLFCLVRWAWDTDRPPQQRVADVGGGIMLPTYMTGPQSHGWWAAIILNVNIGMIFLMLCFAYLYLLGVNPEWWLVAPPLTELPLIAGLLVGALILAYFARPALRMAKGGTAWANAMMQLSAIMIAASLYVDFLSWSGAGLKGWQSGQAAAIYAMQAWHATVVAAVVVLGFYLFGRYIRGLITRPVSATLESFRLFFLFAAAEGLVLALLPRFVIVGGA